MNKRFLMLGALLAGLAVIAGAFGAHFLKTILAVEQLQTFETAVRYQFYHALALIIAGILYKDFTNTLMQWAGRFFIAGMVLFSGSLYLLCVAASPRWIGAITPLGGVCFITGWVLLAIGCNRKN